jgi:hypothetical protein
MRFLTPRCLLPGCVADDQPVRTAAGLTSASLACAQGRPTEVITEERYRRARCTAYKQRLQLF